MIFCLKMVENRLKMTENCWERVKMRFQEKTAKVRQLEPFLQFKFDDFLGGKQGE